MNAHAGTGSGRWAAVITLSGVLVVLVTAGLYWFQPWKLWTDHVVDEPLSRIAALESTSVATIPFSLPVAGSVPSHQVVLLADGELISQEHSTTGSVELIRLASGRRVLTLENLRTSNGPALHVWLTDAPVLPEAAGWAVFDDGRHLDLGQLKGNIGDQMYPVGDDVDLGGYSSVTIWCERFSVSFGAAELSGA